MNDTICALATAVGGAIGIIRISGSQSLEILSRIFQGTGDVLSYPANTIHYGHIVSKLLPPSEENASNALPSSGEEGQGVEAIMDEVMVSIFHAPHSYTGEDSVEISCHGSRYILNKVLDLLIQNGCRMANPGEYTQRAYLNGKMDLSQAEAVADLIASTNKATHQMAMNQLRGHFSSELAQLREQLLKLTSLLELELDFSDHEDLEFADRSELLELTKTIDNHITRLARSFETGQALKQGIPVAIVGKTNVGKSTLLNRLVKDDRAIVSDIHGTTRDTIEETMEIQSVQFRFIDTAGIRKTSETIEQMGIERTYQMIEKARIVIWVLDNDNKPDTEEFIDMLERTKDKSLILVENKCDDRNIHRTPLTTWMSQAVPSISDMILISAKYNLGIEELEQAIYKAANIPALSDSDVIVSSARQYDALIRAHDNLARVLAGLHDDLSGDLIAEDLKLVIEDLAQITGDKGIILPQEVLNNIFSHFCVGK